MFEDSIWLWVGFNLFVLMMLAVDLGIFHRKAHAVSAKEASAWTAVWIGLALSFNLAVFFWQGQEKALEFTTAYVIEKSLSVDNIFVFLVIFTTFRVAPSAQHRVLFWGILGALVMRGAMIAGASALLDEFHWVIYLFGGFLLLTGLRLALQKEVQHHPENNPVLKLARKVLPVSDQMEGNGFFIRKAGKLMVTPLFLVLLVVEATDLVFAVDSVPAVLAVSDDSFIVYTSNVFAILGLRSLYFLLQGAMGKFHYLKLALSMILIFVGFKMVVSEVYKVPILLSLGIILGILAAAVYASMVRATRMGKNQDRPTHV